MFLISSGSLWLQILFLQTSAQFFSGESTAYVAAWRDFEQQSQLRGWWEDNCARSLRQESIWGSTERWPGWGCCWRPADTHRLVETYWRQAKKGCKEKLCRVDVGQAQLRGSVHGSLPRDRGGESSCLSFSSVQRQKGWWVKETRCRKSRLTSNCVMSAVFYYVCHLSASSSSPSFYLPSSDTLNNFALITYHSLE